MNPAAVLPIAPRTLDTEFSEWNPETLRTSVLVVEDDAAVSESITSALRFRGYPADFTSNLSEARAALERKTYGAVICDYGLPDGNGLNLLNWLEGRQSRIPFILMTGMGPALGVQAVDEGAVEFLRKPFGIDDLCRTIEQSLARSRRSSRQFFELSVEMLHGTICALVAAVDAKDPYTASHSERVGNMAVAVGKVLGFDEGRLRFLHFSALVHDVGKIGVPGAIIRKVEALSEEEMAILRTHSERGEQILMRVPGLQEVARVVRSHHERPDGHGYPDQLCAGQIPLFSLIIGVVDAYEAMTSGRAYRPAISGAAARSEIVRWRGSQFCPTVVDAFLEAEL